MCETLRLQGKKNMEDNIKAESLVTERRGRSVLTQQLPVWIRGGCLKTG